MTTESGYRVPEPGHILASRQALTGTCRPTPLPCVPGTTENHDHLAPTGSTAGRRHLPVRAVSASTATLRQSLLETPCFRIFVVRRVQCLPNACTHLHDTTLYNEFRRHVWDAELGSGYASGTGCVMAAHAHAPSLRRFLVRIGLNGQSQEVNRVAHGGRAWPSLRCPRLLCKE